MRSLLTEEDHKQQTNVSQLLQEAVIRLCQKNYLANDVEIDGIICISFQNSYKQHVVKIHEKLKTDFDVTETDVVETDEHFEASPPGLVVCDLTNMHDLSQKDRRSYELDNENSKNFRRNLDSVVAGSLHNRKFSDKMKSRRKRKNISYNISYGKEMSFQDDAGYEDDEANRMQHLYNSKETSLEESSSPKDDVEMFNSEFIVIKNEPTDDEEDSENRSHSEENLLEGDVSLNDKATNQEEDVSTIHDEADAMYIIKNESSYETDQQLLLPSDQQDVGSLEEPDGMDKEMDSLMVSGNVYNNSGNRSLLSDTFSSQSNIETTDGSHNTFYNTSKNTVNIKEEDQNNFNVISNRNKQFREQSCLTPSDQKSFSTRTQMSFPHLKLKSFHQPNKVLAHRNRPESMFSPRATKFSGSVPGVKRHSLPTNLAGHSGGSGFGSDDFDKKRIYFCRYCGKGFTMKCTQMRHEKTICDKGGGANYKCEVCDKFFTRSDSRLRHMSKTHGINMIKSMT